MILCISKSVFVAAEVLREALFLHSEVIWLWSKLLARRARDFAEHLTKKGPHLDHETAIQRKTKQKHNLRNTDEQSPL